MRIIAGSARGRRLKAPPGAQTRPTSDRVREALAANLKTTPDLPHDLAVARLLAHRMLVMKEGRAVETGLTDQVLDDPQHPYTQLLVSSVLQP